MRANSLLQSMEMLKQRESDLPSVKDTAEGIPAMVGTRVESAVSRIRENPSSCFGQLYHLFQTSFLQLLMGDNKAFLMQLW